MRREMGGKRKPRKKVERNQKMKKKSMEEG
jgi:hypothetical protein